MILSALITALHVGLSVITHSEALLRISTFMGAQPTQPRFALVFFLGARSERGADLPARSHVARLLEFMKGHTPKALDEGQRPGRTVVDMKKDWKQGLPLGERTGSMHVTEGKVTRTLSVVNSAPESRP